jgi:hypothetical protein
MRELIINPTLIVLILLTFFNITGAQTLEDYLQADFQFIDGALTDGSPNMLDGTGFDLSTVYGYDGSPNSALHFNGNSSYILCSADDRNITDQLTISAWFRTLSDERQIIVSKYDQGADKGYFIGILNGFATLEGRDGTTNFHRITTEDVRVDDGRWHHLVGIIDKNIWKLYLDCQLLGTLDTGNDTPQFSIPDQLTIGRLSVPTGEGLYRYFAGEIDNVELYNYPVSEFELTNLSESGCSNGNPDLLDGLVAYYPFNGDAQDYSGNDLHGVISGAIPTLDRFALSNAALQFDGTDDYVQVDHDPLLNFGTWPFAISAWVKATDPDGGPQMILHKGISGTGGQYWFRENGFEEEIHLRGVVTEGEIPATEIIVTDPIFDDLSWHHIVFQRTSVAIEFWVDGELAVRLFDTQYRNVDSEGELLIGAQNPWLPGGNFPYIHHHFAGSIDEVRLYNRSLSPEEVLAVSNTDCPETFTLDSNPVYSLYRAGDTLSTSGSVLVTSATTFKAGRVISLQPGFHVLTGTEFLAEIEDCLPAVPAFISPESAAEAFYLETSIDEKPGLGMKVAPNPAQSDIRITIQVDEPVSANLQLLDMTGRPLMVLFQSRLLDQDIQTMNADISHLPAGLYLLSFRTEKGVVTKKIIKNQ